jgi:hypothetical protein
MRFFMKALFLSFILATGASFLPAPASAQMLEDTAIAGAIDSPANHMPNASMRNSVNGMRDFYAHGADQVQQYENPGAYQNPSEATNEEAPQPAPEE